MLEGLVLYRQFAVQYFLGQGILPLSLTKLKIPLLGWSTDEIYNWYYDVPIVELCYFFSFFYLNWL